MPQLLDKQPEIKENQELVAGIDILKAELLTDTEPDVAWDYDDTSY